MNKRLEMMYERWGGKEGLRKHLAEIGARGGKKKKDELKSPKGYATWSRERLQENYKNTLKKYWEE